MDLFLDINQNNGIWIDGTHPVFEKSEFVGLGFRVKINPLTRSKLRILRKESATRSGIDQDIYLPKIFMSQVVDWRLRDGDGRPIPFSEENKKVLLEQFPGFTNLIAAACLDAQVKTGEEFEEEVKNSVTSGAGE